MAEAMVMTGERTEQTVGAEDLVGVRSRISWGPIVAGSVLALAMYFLLTLLGGAIGFSISDKFEGKTISIAAAVYAIVVTAASLFVGGLISSQLTAGENRREAIIYGVLVWAAVFTMLLWLMAIGVRAGFNTMVGVATAGGSIADVAANNVSQADAEAAARKFGFSQAQIDEAKAKAKNAPAEARAAMDDPATKAKADEAAREAGEIATRVTWWSFFGTLVSMLAAAAGGYVGSGPTLRLFATTTQRRATIIRP